MSEEIEVAQIRPVQIITQGRYIGLAKKFNPVDSANLTGCNVTDRGINIAGISANKFNGYWVLELNVRLLIPDTAVYISVKPYPVKFKTVPEVPEEEFSKFLSTAMWMLV